MTALGDWAVIADPDPDPCWLHRNIRVKGFVGEVDLPTDQYIRRPIDHIFQDACKQARALGLPDGGSNKSVLADVDDASLTDDNCAHIVEASELDDYGSMLFKFKYWGVPER